MRMAIHHFTLLVAMGNLNIAQYLIREEHCNPSCENKYGMTPLHYACHHGNLNIAQYLIREVKAVIIM